MRKVMLAICLLAIVGASVAYAMPGGAPAKPDIDPNEKQGHLVTVQWTHRSDGGVITFTVDNKANWTITKVFTPSKEGAKVPVIEPKNGVMAGKWFNKLVKFAKTADYANWKEAYPSEKKDGYNYKVTVTHQGKSYTTEIIDLDGNKDVSEDLRMTTTIGWIMYDVHGKK